VQVAPAADDAPLSILDGLTAISSAGYAAGVVALNPLAVGDPGHEGRQPPADLRR
jgi:hypothetical protein